MKSSTETIILRLIKCYSLLLLTVGILITISPLIAYIYTHTNNDLQDTLGQLPEWSLLYSGVIFAIFGGYCILVAIGYWRQKLWGVASGVFILATAIFLATSGQTEWAPKGLIQTLGVLIGAFHLLPIFVWKHFYNLDKIDDKKS